MEGEIMFEECINSTMKINVSIKFPTIFRIHKSICRKKDKLSFLENHV